MRRRGIRNQLILNSLLLIFLPLISFTTYIFWHVYRVNPTDFMQLLLILSGAFVFTMILAILLSINLSKKFIAPIEAITAAARRIAAGRLSERVHIRTGNEIDFLALALNHLASRLEDKLDEISAEKQKLQLILEHMDNAVMLFDQHGCLVEGNRSALLWFHLTPAMIGQHHLNILGSSQFDSACKETLQLRQPQQQILRTNFQGTKKTYQVSLVALPIKDDVPSGVLAVFHDVTSLQLIQERQSDFVANASHELATPLTAIRGFAETLVDGAADHAADSRHFAAIILSEADRMQRLVQDLLQLAKIESAEYRQQFHYSATRVQPMLESVIRELTPVWLQKQLLVQLDPPDDLLWTMTDPDRLKQILVNLIDNAIKYTPDGGAIQVGAALVGNQIQFTVKDSGIGIPAEDLPRIFDRFYRIDKARARAVGGTGLGLAIVKHLLDALGGTIEVESRQDVGTIFRFYLPVAAADLPTEQ
jgi:two-component system phosphate regulon sensor histidine kinase PhoR